MQKRCWLTWLLLVGLLPSDSVLSDPPKASTAWEKLAPHFQTPEKYAGDFGRWPSPLVKADGTRVKSKSEWPARRAEIEASWRKLLGPAPALLDKPKIKYLAERKRGEITEHHVHVEPLHGRTSLAARITIPTAKTTHLL